MGAKNLAFCYLFLLFVPENVLFTCQLAVMILGKFSGLLYRIKVTLQKEPHHLGLNSLLSSVLKDRKKECPAKIRGGCLS